MSWDIILCGKLDASVKTLEDFGDRYGGEREGELPPLGSHNEVIAAITRVHPDADFSDPTWGRLETPFGEIEFNMGDSDEDPIQTVMLHVRAGEEIIGVIQAICESTRWRALDIAAGEFMDVGDYGETSRQSLKGFRSFRDQILDKSSGDQD